MRAIIDITAALVNNSIVLLDCSQTKMMRIKTGCFEICVTIFYQNLLTFSMCIQYLFTIVE